MAYRPAYKPPAKKPDPARRACLGVVYFIALAAIAYGLYTLIDSRVGFRQVLQVGNEVPDTVLVVVGSLALLLILHLLVLFGVSIVRGARTDGTRT